MKKNQDQILAGNVLVKFSESNMKQHTYIYKFHQQGHYVGCFKDPEIGNLQGEIPGKTFFVNIWSPLSHSCSIR